MNALRMIFLGAALVATSLTASAAIKEGRTSNDRPYVSGGVGLEESERLKQMAENFSLQLIVSSRSGAYLADARVVIVGTNNQKVLDVALDAPWLLVDLTPGSYRVSVAHAGSTQERNVTLAAGKREQIVVQFNVPADTAKDPSTPAK